MIIITIVIVIIIIIIITVIYNNKERKKGPKNVKLQFVTWEPKLVKLASTLDNSDTNSTSLY